MDAAAEIEFTQSTFNGIMRREAQRLSTGATLRRYMHDQLELGNPVDHYRLEWIKKSVMRLIVCLHEIGKEFNEAHPNDKVSGADFLDILQSTYRTVSMRAGGFID